MNQNCKELALSNAIDSIKDGNFDSFNLVYSAYYNPVYDFLRRKVLDNPSVAEDLASETFIKFLVGVDGYNHSNSARLRSYLFSIAFRLFVDHYRRVRNISMLNIDEEVLNIMCSDSNVAETAFDKKILRRVIHSKVDLLPENYRILIRLFYLEELSYKEIQSRLDISEGTLKVRLNRARQILKKKLGRIRSAELI